MDQIQPCVACREPIRAGASLCRYCGASQQENPWKTITTALKWAGGVIAVISLLVGMIALTGQYRDWRERRVTLAELVQAADWLVETRDYAQAWNIYAEALELAPASTDVRWGQYRLAKVWVRDFTAENAEADALLDRITHILYRGIRSGGKEETAIALAHAGWAQVLRSENKLPVTREVESIFQRALAENPQDAYANAMNGYWMLSGRDVSVENLTQAQAHFATALEADAADAADAARAFVRRLQLDSLERQSHGQPDEVAQEALGALLRASASMQRNGEKRPSQDLRYKILNAYGAFGRGENVEDSLSALPPAEHLAVLDWLMEGLTYTVGTGRARNLTQLHYVRARLREAMGESQQALQQYRALLSATNSTRELDGLIDTAIERLSGKPPARALARNYRDDPVDTTDPWNFHLQTITHFDPAWQPENFNQALNFFDYQIGQSNRHLPELLDTLHKAIDRIQNLVSGTYNVARRYIDSSGYSESDLENARINLLRLSLMYEKALLATGDHDGAIAVLSDLEQFSEKLGDRWETKRLKIAYELARAYSLRAGKTGDPEDVEKVVSYLTTTIQGGGVDGEIASWDEIKGETFMGMRKDLGYRKLIWGR